jgi:hypothetical protein
MKISKEGLCFLVIVFIAILITPWVYYGVEMYFHWVEDVFEEKEQPVYGEIEIEYEPMRIQNRSATSDTVAPVMRWTKEGWEYDY